MFREASSGPGAGCGVQSNGGVRRRRRSLTLFLHVLILGFAVASRPQRLQGVLCGGRLQRQRAQWRGTINRPLAPTPARSHRLPACLTMSDTPGLPPLTIVVHRQSWGLAVNAPASAPAALRVRLAGWINGEACQDRSSPGTASFSRWKAGEENGRLSRLHQSARMPGQISQTGGCCCMC